MTNLEDAEAEKIRAELPKVKIEAEKAAEPELPSLPEIKAPEGSVTVADTSGLVGRLVGYRALDDAAQQLVAAVAAAEKKHEPPRPAPVRVLIVDSPDLLGSDWPYQLISGQLKEEAGLVKAALGDLETPTGPRPAETEAAGSNRGLMEIAALPGLAAANLGSSAISAAVNLAGLLRTDYTVGGGESKLGSLPMTSAIARAVIHEGWKVVVDDFDLVRSPLIASFWRAWDKRVELGQAIDAQRVPHPKKSSPPAGEEDIQRRLAQAEDVAKGFDTFAAAVTAAPKSGYPPLIAAARRQNLHREGDGKPAINYVVYAAVEGGGFESIARKSFWWWTNKPMRYLGGAQVSYLVYDVEAGETIAADNLQFLRRTTLDLSDGGVTPSLPAIRP